MKRIYICIVAILAIIAISSFSLWRVHQVKEETVTRLEEIQHALDQQDISQALEKTQELASYWQEAQNALIRYIRHVPVDDISNRVMGLPALCAHGEYGELQAEMDRITHLLEHIWYSELPVPRNLF